MTNREGEWPRPVQSWECSDGERFASDRAATDHQRGIDASAAAQTVLEGGATIGDVLRTFYEHRWGPGEANGILANIDPQVFPLTRGSLLAIPHWQCIDRPVYAIEKILPSGCFLVWGTVPGPLGSTYGGEVGVRDLESYVRQTVKRCGKVPQGSDS